MAQLLSSFADLSDQQLLAEVQRLVACERQATAELIRSLMELDARRCYLAQGYASLFCYCTQVLHLSEHAALGRIEVARAARRLPVILELLLDGSVTVTNARLLAPHLTERNHRDVLASARHKSKREVEEIVARLRPRPDVAASIRKLPDRSGASEVLQAPGFDSQPAVASATPQAPAPSHGSCWKQAHRPVVAPIAPERYKIQFTVSRETHDKLRRAQELLRHAVPSGDPAAVFERALTLLVEHLEKQKFAATARPRTRSRTGPPAGSRSATASRHIPAAVRRQSGRETRGGAPSWARRVAALRRGFWSSTTSSRSWLEGRRMCPTSSCGVARTTHSRPKCSSIQGW